MKLADGFNGELIIQTSQPLISTVSKTHTHTYSSIYQYTVEVGEAISYNVNIS